MWVNANPTLAHAKNAISCKYFALFQNLYWEYVRMLKLEENMMQWYGKPLCRNLSLFASCMKVTHLSISISRSSFFQLPLWNIHLVIFLHVLENMTPFLLDICSDHSPWIISFEQFGDLPLYFHEDDSLFFLAYRSCRSDEYLIFLHVLIFLLWLLIPFLLLLWG